MNQWRIIIAVLMIWMSAAANVLMAQQYEIPKIKSHDQVIRREAYTLSFNDHYRLANWVAYVLTSDETVARVNRFEGVFTPDPLIEISPDNGDYWQSGYDRGHLAPAADMEFSSNTMQESFYFSNIAPQTPAFNRGIWKRLECLQRLWAKEYDSVYIVTGPVLKGKLNTIGEHNVAIPQYFYKVIMRKDKNGQFLALGFVLPNKDSKSRLMNRAVSVDSVESATGINFFHQLPDNIEKRMEKTVCTSCWNWHSGDRSVEVVYGNGSQQCKALTKSGKQCSRMTNDPSGYCFQHKLK